MGTNNPLTLSSFIHFHNNFDLHEKNNHAHTNVKQMPNNILPHIRISMLIKVEQITHFHTFEKCGKNSVIGGFELLTLIFQDKKC